MFINLKNEEKIVHIKYDVDNIITELKSGIYDISKDNGYLFFAENKAFKPGKIAKAGIFEQVTSYVDNYFSDNGSLVRKAMNQQTRLGLFFKGDPGTGKSFLAGKITLDLIEKFNGIGIYTTKLGFDFTEIVDAVRPKESNRLVVFILDEFEKDYSNVGGHERDQLLSFLDGGRSRDNVVVIATANSLSGIPPTLLQRPGRFEKVVEFRITDDVVLTNLIHALVPEELLNKLNIEETKKRALRLDILTIDSLKSMIRDALISVLNTGKAFPSEMLVSIKKEDIEKESKQGNNNKKKRTYRNINDVLSSLMNADRRN